MFQKIDDEMKHDNDKELSQKRDRAYSFNFFGEDDVKEMAETNIKFYNHINQVNESSNIQIVNILTTCQENLFQIIAKNHSDDTLIVVTWDFDINKEFSMYQLRSEPDSFPEYYITKGLLEKNNYFMDSHQAIDLEHNIPM